MKKIYRLANSKQHANLLDYEQIITEKINEIVPGKNPKVYADHFETDELTHSEAVTLGRALSRLPELQQLGKRITTFRLFRGSFLK